ncbi:hypothetical protein ANCCAN_15641 [Ancylostoma caninum]|uniref:PHD-type domain-containing protein n=1 Tax=Ancylostoma caninum TaxID=29170 RepID=A0A368G1X0_ANCCA|nr:hypothetical protein ANCCAN_15641 [Ancylostoma caninum]
MLLINESAIEPSFHFFYFKASNLHNKLFLLALLWANESVNFFAEKAFNQSAARSWPHCAVCQYFQPLHMSSYCREIPERSTRLAFAFCFAKDERRLPAVDPDEDVLLTCSNCGVTVHPSCYGGASNSTITGKFTNLTYPSSPSYNLIIVVIVSCSVWQCLRCRDRDDVAIRGRSCHLCELRGGALMPCRAGADISAFVHTICAIFNRSVF